MKKNMQKFFSSTLFLLATSAFFVVDSSNSYTADFVKKDETGILRGEELAKRVGLKNNPDESISGLQALKNLRVLLNQKEKINLQDVVDYFCFGKIATGVDKYVPHADKDQYFVRRDNTKKSEKTIKEERQVFFDAVYAAVQHAKDVDLKELVKKNITDDLPSYLHGHIDRGVKIFVEAAEQIFKNNRNSDVVNKFIELSGVDISGISETNQNVTRRRDERKRVFVPVPDVASLEKSAKNSGSSSNKTISEELPVVSSNNMSDVSPGADQREKKGEVSKIDPLTTPEKPVHTERKRIQSPFLDQHKEGASQTTPPPPIDRVRVRRPTRTTPLKDVAIEKASLISPSSTKSTKAALFPSTVQEDGDKNQISPQKPGVSPRKPNPFEERLKKQEEEKRRLEEEKRLEAENAVRENRERLRRIHEEEEAERQRVLVDQNEYALEEEKRRAAQKIQKEAERQEAIRLEAQRLEEEKEEAARAKIEEAEKRKETRAKLLARYREEVQKAKDNAELEQKAYDEISPESHTASMVKGLIDDMKHYKEQKDDYASSETRINKEAQMRQLVKGLVENKTGEFAPLTSEQILLLESAAGEDIMLKNIIEIIPPIKAPVQKEGISTDSKSHDDGEFKEQDDLSDKTSKDVLFTGDTHEEVNVDTSDSDSENDEDRNDTDSLVMQTKSGKNVAETLDEIASSRPRLDALKKNIALPKREGKVPSRKGKAFPGNNINLDAGQKDGDSEDEKGTLSE